MMRMLANAMEGNRTTLSESFVSASRGRLSGRVLALMNGRDTME